MDSDKVCKRILAILNAPPDAMPEIQDAILAADYAVMDEILGLSVTPTVERYIRDALDAEFILDDPLDAEYLSDE